MKKKLIYFVLAQLALFNPVIAEEITDTVTGVNYEVDENGNFTRIRSVGQAELSIADAKDIRTAIQKANMRAKANIAKFLTEQIKSEEVINNVEKQITSNNGKDGTVNRETIEDYMEKISNNSEAILKGVIAVREDVNKEEKWVKVELGYSPKTQQTADTISNNLNQDTSKNENSSTHSTENQSSGTKTTKAKNYDSF